jgi:ParB-like chromosome segregation protein Spo0J
LTDDELRELADDIAEHGLLHPIVLDADGVLIDGRNRLRACELAGVEPFFTELNGRDAAAFIVSANLNRRNLTKGQQAMALAMIYPDTEKGGRGIKGKAEVSSDFSQKRLAQARAVLRHSEALAQGVLAKHISLDAALEVVAKQQRESQSADAMMGELRAEAPDLADLVDEERLNVAEAYSALEERRLKAAKLEANKRETLLRLETAGFPVAVCRSVPEVLDAVAAAGVPVRGRVA